MWARDLVWSFEPTRRRMEAALDEDALSGLVAHDQRGACAYATWAIDGDRGIVGSFFSSSRSRQQGLETLLVRDILEQLLAQRLRVVDCQTLFSSDPGLREPFARKGFESADRIYMTIKRNTWLRDRSLRALVASRPTPPVDLRSVAHLVHEAHQDSEVRDASSSFDTEESCERILRQIMVDDVCGPFDPVGSRTIEESGMSRAVSLLTWPWPRVAHISEIATRGPHRRRGLARQCLNESLTYAFEQRQAETATLSVTAANTAALALYESVGFVSQVRYHSHVLRRPLP